VNALTTILCVSSLTANFATAEDSRTHRGSSPCSGPTGCAAETGGPTTVNGLEGIVPYTPIPNTHPFYEPHCFHAGARCSSSSPSPGPCEGALTPGAVRLHSAVMHFHMMVHNTRQGPLSASASQPERCIKPLVVEPTTAASSQPPAASTRRSATSGRCVV
jgi:hypothetical protein